MTSSTTASDDGLTDLPGITASLELGFPPERLSAAARFLAPVVADGAMPARTKLAMLFVIATVRGNQPVAEFAFRQGLLSGLTRQEFGDALLTGTLSRGVGVLMAGMPRLGEAPSAPDERWGDDPATATLEEMLDYFGSQHGSAPAAVELMAEHAAPVFESYFGLRSVVLADGPLPHRHKELLVATLNMIDRYEWGLELHLGSALQAGASYRECVEAILVAVVLGGIPVWLETVPVLQRLWAESGPDDARREQA